MLTSAATRRRETRLQVAARRLLVARRRHELELTRASHDAVDAANDDYAEAERDYYRPCRHGVPTAFESCRYTDCRSR